jgi:hypothetical protein
MALPVVGTVGAGRGYERAYGAAAANPRLKELCLDAEAEDGYFRDQNVFAPGVTIEDDMAVAAVRRSAANRRSGRPGARRSAAVVEAARASDVALENGSLG